MCGIGGIVGDGAEHELALAEAMNAALAHRGPDDCGLWYDSGVVLTHRRLSILDLSAAGHQPMSYAGGRYWITFNGEIYNYLELRRDLAALGHRFGTASDTEVLLAAYQRWGEDCLPRLNGMWAFAIWDSERRTLFASRDRFGKKPFYYVRRGDRLYFASEMKALLGVPGVRRALNARALADFCAERITDHTAETFVVGIEQLPAASWLRWRDVRLQTGSYWSLPTRPERAGQPPTTHEIGALLDDAVRLRLRADTPVGCLVSGGLDSSTVCCLMRRHQGSDAPIHVFTTLTETPNEEARGVELILRQAGFEPHFHTPTARSFWADLPSVLWHQEEPFADGSMAAHFALMREARRVGVPVLLTGQGADEVFAGYVTYLWVYLGELLRAGRFGALVAAARGTRANQRASWGEVLAHVAVHAAPRSLRGRARLRHARRRLDWLRPDLRAGFTARETYGAGEPDDLHSYLLNSVRHWTLPGFLHYEDRNSGAFGVETRLPFLDVRLVEAMFRVSSAEKLRGGETKRLLREVARPVVPRQIVERQAKQGYPAPLARWLRELAPEVRGLAHSSLAREAEVLDVPVWRGVVDQFLRGENDRLDAVWRGLVCVLWHDRVLHAPKPETRPAPITPQPALTAS